MMPDINSLDLLNEVVEVTSTASAEEFFAPPIPEDGDHKAVLHLGDRGIKVDKQREGKNGPKTGPAYLNVHNQAKILSDSGEEGLSVFDSLTSIVMQSAGTSRLHAVLEVAGDPAPARCSLGELKAHTEAFYAQSAQFPVGITTQWEAQVNDGTQTDPKYRTVLKGMKKFPPVLDDQGNPTGKYNPEVEDPKTGQKVRAQARIIKYFKVR